MATPGTLQRFPAPVNVGRQAPTAKGTRLDTPAQGKSLPSAPLPSEDPDAWDLIPINGKPYPPFDADGRSTGLATVKFAPKVKLDAPGGAGTPKPKVKKTGGELTKFPITFKFNDGGMLGMLALAEELQPGSGPHTIGGPKAKAAKISSFMVEGWDDAPGPTNDGWNTWGIQCIEVRASAQTGKGGGGSGAQLAELDAEIANVLSQLDAIDDIPADQQTALTRASRQSLKDRSLALIAKRNELKKKQGDPLVQTPQVNSVPGQQSGRLADITGKKEAAKTAAKP